MSHLSSLTIPLTYFNNRKSRLLYMVLCVVRARTPTRTTAEIICFILFYVKPRCICVNGKKLKASSVKQHEIWNDSNYKIHVLYRTFHVLFPYDDDRKVASWLRSHVKSLYSVTSIKRLLIRIDLVDVRLYWCNL